MTRLNTGTHLHATGSTEDLEVLRRIATTFGVGCVLSLLSELASTEAEYCLLSGDPVKAAALARRASLLSKAAATVAD